MCPEGNLPSPAEKPSLLDWLEQYFHLPFRLPRIPLAKTAANLDKAAGALIAAGGDNLVARVEATTNRIKAKSSAEVAFIQYGQTSISQTEGLTDRALHYALGDAISAQKNREEILRIAAEDINSDPPKQDSKEPIDEDWLDAFRKYAETKSNADIQQLWGRILSAEIRNPGSSSLRTLSFLSTISSSDANFIAKTFSYVLDGKIIPAGFIDSGELTLSDFLQLHELGIITSLPGLGGTKWQKTSQQNYVDGKASNTVGYIYFKKVLVCENATQPFKWEFSASPLSQIGRELFDLTNTKTPEYELLEKFALANKAQAATKLLVFDAIRNGTKAIAFGIPKTLFEAQ